MTDDIVTRLRRMDASIPSVDPDKYVSPTEAADEIERLRKELQHSALQTNVMRNIATTPFGGAAEQIADLGAELAEFQRQYLVLKKDRDKWRKICDYWYKASRSHNWRQDQAARRKYEEAVKEINNGTSKP